MNVDPIKLKLANSILQGRTPMPAALGNAMLADPDLADIVNGASLSTTNINWLQILLTILPLILPYL